MECIECKSQNPDDNRYCGKCGAELGRTLDETVRKKGFKDRQATEMEITDAVVARLTKWATWLGSAVGLVVLAFTFFLGKSIFDIRAQVAKGEAQIETAALEGKRQMEAANSDVSGLLQSSERLKQEYGRLQSDAETYRQVSRSISNLQKDVSQVKKDVVDLGNRELKARSVTTTGEGPSSLEFHHLGCPPPGSTGTGVSFCAQGSPPVLFQKNSNGDLRPVAGVSSFGFRDTSVSPKPTCSVDLRGLLYVEKSDTKGDGALLCAKRSDGTYAWTALGSR